MTCTQKVARLIAVVLFAAGALVLSSCDKTADPDIGQRDTTANSVLTAAREGDKTKLLELSAVNLQARETAADVLTTQAHALQSNYKIAYAEHHGAPDNYIVTATDGRGASASFELSWNERKWRLILGTASPPQSPAATVSPPS